ncbi:MAG TPA: RnfABCDGE type electron transport complex subunit D [Synergistaceae bacterium]|nr:RnfABCDGE type electron transport complex subunit D [Synergistaceae bacterium]HPQ37709.1 RnfABCDGE type electron transport complex subunit D [Synergistaceae bacterium]
MNPIINPQDIFYTGASSPHIRPASVSVKAIMRDVLLALVPAAFAGVYFFGLKAANLMALGMLTCILAEVAWQKAGGRKITPGDGSAAVTGLLLALTLPPDAPWWIPVIGGIFGIIVVKQFFGGLGQNIMNPALGARAFLVASWPVHMTRWSIDGISGATALEILKNPDASEALPSFVNIFLGHTGGCIGETSVLALLLGGGYLLYRRVITWHIPAVYIGTVMLLTFVLGREGFFSANPFYEACAGGLFLGAFFMATDYATSPMTKRGEMIFALGCGLLTTVIRLYGGYAEGVCYSILIMNLFVPLIDRFIVPRPFGGGYIHE